MVGSDVNAAVGLRELGHRQVVEIVAACNFASDAASKVYFAKHAQNVSLATTLQVLLGTYAKCSVCTAAGSLVVFVVAEQTLKNSSIVGTRCPQHGVSDRSGKHAKHDWFAVCVENAGKKLHVTLITSNQLGHLTHATSLRPYTMSACPRRSVGTYPVALYSSSNSSFTCHDEDTTSMITTKCFLTSTVTSANKVLVYVSLEFDS